MLVRFLILLLFPQVQCVVISQTYEKVPAEQYSALSGSCGFYSPAHWPGRAARCGQMCIMQNCFVFALNGSGCAVCQYVEAASQDMPVWETFTAVLKKRESISIARIYPVVMRRWINWSTDCLID